MAYDLPFVFFIISDRTGFEKGALQNSALKKDEVRSPKRVS